MDEKLEQELYEELVKALKSGQGREAVELRLLKKAATYTDAAKYADKVGDLCAKALDRWLLAAEYPGGIVPQEAAMRNIVRTLRAGYEAINGTTLEVQTQLNTLANIGLKAQSAKFDIDAAGNLARKVARASKESGLEAARALINEPVKTHLRKGVDAVLQVNVDFQTRAGLNPIVRRHCVANCCPWCSEVEGKYNRGDEPDGFYRRHLRCKCTIEFFPGDGRRKIVHNEKKRNPKINGAQMGTKERWRRWPLREEGVKRPPKR